jgi:hypothetical protein
VMARPRVRAAITVVAGRAEAFTPPICSPLDLVRDHTRCFPIGARAADLKKQAGN